MKPACNGVAQFDQPSLVYRERAKSVKFLRHPRDGNISQIVNINSPFGKVSF